VFEFLVGCVICFINIASLSLIVVNKMVPARNKGQLAAVSTLTTKAKLFFGRFKKSLESPDEDEKTPVPAAVVVKKYTESGVFSVDRKKDAA